MFVDKVRIMIKAGDGGDGCVSFHREKYVPDGGPDGGDGGRGGDICFVADSGLRTLIDFSYKRHFKADNGAPGTANNCAGKNAQPLTIKVPLGTVVYDEQTGAVMANLTEPGQVKTVLRGGRGGRGNAKFATPTRRAPRFAQPGQRKAERWVRLELKSIADIGLVGFPNVGKSTTLAALTRATPKIANYHFTTLTPNLGVCSIDNRTYTLADIPGLIEGASEGQGLGHEFLRHVERTRMLIHVIDVSGIEGRDPLEDFETIMHELAQYSEELANRPMIVAANKADLDFEGQNFARLQQQMQARGIPVFRVSAATHEGLKELIRAAAEIVDSLPPVVLEPESFDESTLFTERTYEIHRLSGDVYEVVGDLAEEIIRRVYPQDRDSIRYFGEQLEKHGIIDGLRQKGAKDGDTIVMAGVEFEFVE